MAKILDMPKLSPTMEEGVLSAWHKKEGDAVDVDDLLAEVETDKATMEFRAFDKGTLLKLLVDAGSNVRLGQPVAILGNPGEDIAALVAKAGAAAPKGAAPSPAPTPAAPTTATLAPAAPPSPTPSPTPTRAPTPTPTPMDKGSALTRTEREPARPHASAAGASGEGRVRASPYIRKTARDRGIDLQGAQGSGPGGRLVAADLDRLQNAPDAARAGESRALARAGNGGMAHAPAGLAEPEVRPLSMMRKTIARRLTESKRDVPHFYLTIDVDAAELLQLRERINGELAAPAKDKHNGASDNPLKVSVNDLLIKACAAALVRVPECNASFADGASPASPERGHIQGPSILVHKRVDVSVAVAIPDGLVTPVVRNADQKSVVAIAREVRDLASRARNKKLRPEEMSDGTFSISNLGMFGVDAFSAVINPPEGAILAVGQVRDVPVVANGAVLPGKRLAMTLSCDHRVIDGAVGAAFLAELRGLVEHPMRILTG